MLRSAAVIRIKMIQSNNLIKQNMQKYHTTQCYYFSHGDYSVESALSTSNLQNKNASILPVMVFCNRKFSRSSKLLREIKCVTTSYYEDLGIESNASSKNIKEAFYRQVIEAHNVLGNLQRQLIYLSKFIFEITYF